MLVNSEGGEAIFRNENGDTIIVPRNRRNEAMKYLLKDDHHSLDKLALDLPKAEHYASGGTVIPEDPIEGMMGPETTITADNPKKSIGNFLNRWGYEHSKDPATSFLGAVGQGLGAIAQLPQAAATYMLDPKGNVLPSKALQGTQIQKDIEMSAAQGNIGAKILKRPIVQDILLDPLLLTSEIAKGVSKGSELINGLKKSELINDLGNKYLPNAYKLNPKAFKPNVDAYYRGLGKTGLEDAIEMGYLRSNKMGKFGDDLYLSSSFKEADHYSNNRIPWTILDDGSIVDDMSRASGIDTGKYFAEIPKKSVNAKPYHINDTQYITNETISLDKVRFLKEDWLKGYKEIEVPKSNFKSEIDWNNYLTPEQAAIARSERMLAQESKWNVNSNSYTKDKFTNVKDNFEEVFANEVQGNTKSLGVNKLGKAFVFKDNGLTSANQARIAAHEVGHFYRNLADEADEWNSFFDFSKLKSKTNNYLRGKPTAVKKSISNSKIDEINLKDRGVPHGDEIRERAAQLKDYIAQKNNIPLNKDFTVTEAHLDDAIKNYVKETGLDNNMTEMLSGLVNKKGFLKAMNNKPLAISAPIVAGALANKKTKK